MFKAPYLASVYAALSMPTDLLEADACEVAQLSPCQEGLHVAADDGRGPLP
jgi:hypothetical protein